MGGDVGGSSLGSGVWEEERVERVEFREMVGGRFSKPTGTIREPNSTPIVTSWWGENRPSPGGELVGVCLRLVWEEGLTESYG